MRNFAVLYILPGGESANKPLAFFVPKRLMIWYRPPC